MDITLSLEHRRFVDQLVLEGQFATADEVIAAALTSFAQAELRREVQRGMDDIREGRVSDWNVEEAKQRLIRRMGAKRKAS